MITKTRDLIRRHARERKVKFSIAEKDVRARRPDVRAADEVDLGNCDTVEQLLNQKPGTKPASAATSSGFVVTDEHKQLIREADELIEASGGDMDWGTAAKRAILDRHYKKTGERLPMSVLAGPGEKRRQPRGATPISFSEGGSGASCDFIRESRQLASDENIKVSEAVRRLRKADPDGFEASQQR